MGIARELLGGGLIGGVRMWVAEFPGCPGSGGTKVGVSRAERVGDSDAEPVS